jgi:hypothetical protein
MKRLLPVILLGLSLSACGGRTAQPITVASRYDNSLSCNDLETEIEQNNARLQALAAEKGVTLTKNVAVGAAGILFFPIWFALDLSDAAGQEISQLQARQTYLAEMAGRKCQGGKK